MLALLNAMYTTFTNDPTLAAAFPGGLHRDQAPEGTGMPYVVSKVLKADLEYAYGGVCRSDVQVRLSVFGIGHDAAGALAETLTVRLDDQLLTLSAGVNDAVTRLADPLPLLHPHDAAGNDVWEWQIVYEYGVRM